VFTVSSKVLYSAAIACFNYIKKLYNSIKRLVLTEVTVDKIYSSIVVGKVAYLLITIIH
jgi:hypothetical protein